MTLTIYHWKFTNKALLFFFTELFVYGLCVIIRRTFFYDVMICRIRETGSSNMSANNSFNVSLH